MVNLGFSTIVIELGFGYLLGWLVAMFDHWVGFFFFFFFEMVVVGFLFYL